MLAAIVTIFGVGLCMIGFVAPTMVDIGVAVIIIGLVGMTVRAIDLMRGLRGR